MKTFLTILFFLPIGILLHATVAADLFNWFISPLGVQEINKSHAYGISCFISLFFIGRATSAEAKGTDGPEHLIRNCVQLLFNTLFIWGFAAVAHSMM
jgi:hypothetical protein